MGFLFGLFLLPLQPFLHHPWATAAVAGVLSANAMRRGFSAAQRIPLGLAACAWWGFTYAEATVPVQANIRVDLVMFGPVYAWALIYGGYHLFKGPPNEV